MDRVGDATGRKARGADGERQSRHLAVKAATVSAAAVLSELLPVVRDKHHHGVPLEAKRSQAREQPTDMLIGECDFAVVAVYLARPEPLARMDQIVVMRIEIVNPQQPGPRLVAGAARSASQASARRLTAVELIARCDCSMSSTSESS